MTLQVSQKLLEKTSLDLDLRYPTVMAELHRELRDKVYKLLEMFDGALSPYEGFRDEAAQQSRLAAGNSKAAWLHSPHNYRPALACDLVLHPRIVKVAAAHGPPYGWPNLWDYETPEAVQVYDELHKAAIGLGLARVMLGSKRDHPHVELPKWRSYLAVH